jgi:hypothetical protein
LGFDCYYSHYLTHRQWYSFITKLNIYSIVIGDTVYGTVYILLCAKSYTILYVSGNESTNNQNANARRQLIQSRAVESEQCQINKGVDSGNISSLFFYVYNALFTCQSAVLCVYLFCSLVVYLMSPLCIQFHIYLDMVSRFIW